MAERRMFSKAIVNSGRFLRMPPTTRLLYYDLGMAADDDGIVEAFTVMRSNGCTEDDLRVLISKDFVRILNEDLVTQIMDWKTNNLIKTDRYHPSVYAELLQDNGTKMEPKWNPNGTQTEPEVRLVKEREGKSNIRAFRPPTLEEVKAYCQERGRGVDPERWYNHYQAVEWRVGRNRMKDWKAAVRTWEPKQKGGYEEW